jgi:hypothetical protein
MHSTFWISASILLLFLLQASASVLLAGALFGEWCGALVAVSVCFTGSLIFLDAFP